MKIRLQEIELGSADVEKTKNFYQAILGLETTVDEPNLAVFNLTTNVVDFNISTHLSAQSLCISFLTDHLEEIMEKLNANSIAFDGPKPSHLGMISIEFKDPTGNRIKVNQRSEASPEWLK